MNRILAVNPGATSTKFAVFDDEQPVLQHSAEHHGSELQHFARVSDQADFRLALITAALDAASIPQASLQAVVGRGGLLKPLSGGTYGVNRAMLDDLHAATRGEHASNLGGIIADALAQRLGISAFIVDPVSVDEMEPAARLSGHPEIPRDSLSHALNSKAVARRAAADMGTTYGELNLLIAHLGSGISVTAHRRGRMIDVNNAQEEGPFSPDRCGGLPARKLVKLCFSGKYTETEMAAQLMGKGGIFAYLGSRDLREVEARAASGDAQAELVFTAMAYQIAKEIGAMATVLGGAVDRIVITGGMAWSRRLVDEVSARVGFIAPIVLLPGEEELPALAAGALRVLRGEEPAQTY
ncbi:MAG: butyrate kinase [Burkholderiaceae bacterium]|nr:butyrate kinase [Sulfuritalea sp.]MCF8175538.1 butyrate kinase [Burkholderiaceae bacterium]